MSIDTVREIEDIPVKKILRVESGKNRPLARS